MTEHHICLISLIQYERKERETLDYLIGHDWVAKKPYEHETYHYMIRWESYSHEYDESIREYLSRHR